MVANFHACGWLQANKVTPLRRKPAAIFQLNIGLYCNQVGMPALNHIRIRYCVLMALAASTEAILGSIDAACHICSAHTPIITISSSVSIPCYAQQLLRQLSETYS